MDRRQRDHRLAPLVQLPRPWLCAITAGRGAAAALAHIRAAAAAGVDFIQIREKALSARDLFELCGQARRTVGNAPVRLLVNGRWDIALAAGLDGIHLPADGLPAAELRRFSPPGFLIGQSCHAAAEVFAASGADFCLLGPIFATPSKPGPELPLTPAALAAASPRPVLALGGITPDNAASCLAQGAAGVAGIRLFESDPVAAAARLRRLSWASAR